MQGNNKISKTHLTQKKSRNKTIKGDHQHKKSHTHDHIHTITSTTDDALHGHSHTPDHSESDHHKYINREVSWLRFNLRVSEESISQDNPLLERLRFLSIFTSNLDEFFMIRVGSLFDQSQIEPNAIDPKSGMSVSQQLDTIYKIVGEMVPKVDAAYSALQVHLEKYNIKQIDLETCDKKTLDYTKKYFTSEILPLLSPQIINSRHPFPHLENKRVYVIVKILHKEKHIYGLIQVPTVLPQTIVLPQDGIKFVNTLDLIFKYAQMIFPSNEIIGKAQIRATRNADIAIDDHTADEDIDFKTVMLLAIKKRKRLAPVRLEATRYSDKSVVDYIAEKCNLSKEKVFIISKNFSYSFVDAIDKKMDSSVRKLLSFEPHIPKWPEDLSTTDIMGQVMKKDHLLCYPYHSTKPFIELLREASMDPEVVSIKITLYRLCSQSQVAEYLCAAAEAGKEVTAVIELRARFDEENNINWSNRFYESGCNVIYGLEGYKIHSKVMLITKKTKDGLVTITHIGTGNYNEKTARIYTDFNILTSDPEIGKDAMELFKNITEENIAGDYKRLLVAPTGLKPAILALISEECGKAQQGLPCGITAKMNSLTDKDVINALIDASQKGVHIRLLIRGICCLRPGIPGITENIQVISIVGRFLEHSRVYIFGAVGEEKVYISSADMMTRNTERRIEIACPVLDNQIAQAIINDINIQLNDNVKARKLLETGTYEYIKVTPSDVPLNSQEHFIKNIDQIAKTDQVEYGKPTETNQPKPLASPTPTPVNEPAETPATEEPTPQKPKSFFAKLKAFFNF